MDISRPRSLLTAGAMLFAMAAIAAPALCQDRAAAKPIVVAQAERPLPVRIDSGARYLVVAPGTISHAPNPGEAQRVHDALERQGFRLVHERNATALTMGNGIKRLIENGVRPENISVLGMGDDVQALIDVAQQVYNPQVAYIVIAGCQKAPSFASRVPLKGRILSLQMEKPGTMPTCRPIFAGRGAAAGFQFEEYVIKRDPSTTATSELVLVEAINAWTRAGYEDDGVR